MTMGERISQLRKDFGFSQEYIAEQLSVSRQAVSKWEQDKSKPDTENLIMLAEIFHTSVEYVAAGKVTVVENAIIQKPKKKLSKKVKYILSALLLSALALVMCIATVVHIYKGGVAWDAGACGGGFVTHIFDKYEEELTARFRFGLGVPPEDLLSLEAVRGTQSADWNGNTIYLYFDIRYEHKKYGVVTERVLFIGKRYWIEKYRFGGAIIQG